MSSLYIWIIFDIRNFEDRSWFGNWEMCDGTAKYRVTLGHLVVSGGFHINPESGGSTRLFD